MVEQRLNLILGETQDSLSELLILTTGGQIQFNFILFVLLNSAMFSEINVTPAHVLSYYDDRCLLKCYLRINLN